MKLEASTAAGTAAWGEWEKGPFASGEAGEGYRRLFAALPVPALIIDSRGFVRLANQPASEFLHLSGSALLQRRSMLHHLDPEGRQRLVWRLQDRSGLEAFEMRGMSVRVEPDHMVPCDLSLVHLDGAATLEPMSLLVVVDRSLEASLRQTSRELRRQGQRLAEVLWASQSGTWEWEAASRETMINDRFAQILGTALTDINVLNERQVRELIHPQDRRGARALMARLRRGHEASFSLRLRLAFRGGGWIWVLARGRVLERDDHDHPVRVAGTIQDISAEVEREAALLAAKEEAEAVQRLRSQWLANVGHEVRTPLNSVLGLLQLMREQTSDERQRGFINRMSEATELLRHTLDDLLDSAKLEAGQMVIERVQMDLRDLATSVISVFSHQAQAAGVRLNLKLAADLPRIIWGDPLRLRQVINNLVSNALKFTPRGQVDVSIEGKAEHSGEAMELLVRVRDSGVGIEPQHLPRLFTPYFQADASTTRRYGGTGLGLSICQRLVRLMGGEIGVDSVAGQGSLFWFTAKVGLAADRLTATAAKPAELKEEPVLRSPWALSSDSSRPVLPENSFPDDMPVDTQQTQTRLQDLRRSLLMQDLGSIELCRRLIADSKGSTALRLRTVLGQAEQFEFEAAVRELDALSRLQAQEAS